MRYSNRGSIRTSIWKIKGHVRDKDNEGKRRRRYIPAFGQPHVDRMRQWAAGYISIWKFSKTSQKIKLHIANGSHA